MVLELLSLRRRRTEERTAGRHEVGPREVKVTVDQEVLLLGTGIGDDGGGLLVPEELEHALRLLVERLARAQERRLLVERLARPRHEGRRDAERGPVRVLEDVGRAGDVPGGVAARLEGGADAAAREARRVGLALDERLAGELDERPALPIGREEAVMLLGREARQRVEDVRVMRGALLDGPVLHGRRDDVGDGRVELRSLVDGPDHGLVHRLGEPLLHDGAAEHVRSEELADLDLGEIQRLRDR